MRKVNLVMPMAGRGSRFATAGFSCPKPLITISGRPFFWWAVESVRRMFAVDNIVFVVLQEHVIRWNVDQEIRRFYSSAKLEVLPDVTLGSAETALIGMQSLERDAAVIINDCDHAFIGSEGDGSSDRAAATLFTFPSTSPHYSYVQYNGLGEVVGTVEKKVVSSSAIAGCYLFRSADVYREAYRQYKARCPYDELYVSGIYNTLAEGNSRLDATLLAEHFAFGTPEEFAAAEPRMSLRLANWC